LIYLLRKLLCKLKIHFYEKKDWSADWEGGNLEWHACTGCGKAKLKVKRATIYQNYYPDTH
jgi:hypothetical protein